MEDRLNLIDWFMVAAVFVSIIGHRMFLSAVEKGEDATNIANFVQIITVLIMLLFMMMVAGAVIFVWQKLTADPNRIVKNPPKFPKLSFSCATAAFVVFSIYWLMFSK